MAALITGGGGGGGGRGVASGGGSSESTVISKEETIVDQQQQQQHQFEVSDESELELGLGLSLSVVGPTKRNHHNQKQQHQQGGPRILTAKDFTSPSSASSSSSAKNSNVSNNTPNNNNNNNSNSNNVSAGTKRAASPTGVSQVVGWPPIRSYRMNSMANQAKTIATGEKSSEFDEIKRNDVEYGADEKGNGNSKERAPVKSCLFVKVNMDGVAIGRKVDLNAHPSYESLARMLEEMFTNRAVEKSSGEELMLMPKVTRPSKLLDGSSDYVLTYEDKDGDWMLVGDVPWSMFLSSVKRLRIMRTSEANGLAPRSEERSMKQRSRPI